MEAGFDSAGHADNVVVHDGDRVQACLAYMSRQFFLLVIGVETAKPVPLFAASSFQADIEKAAWPECAV